MVEWRKLRGEGEEIVKKAQKKSVAFFERNSWYHRTKIVNENGTVKYGKKGGFTSKEDAEKSYYRYEKEINDELRKLQLSNK